VRQGEIRPYRPIGPRREVLVVVVSGDDYNQDPLARPLCLDIAEDWPASEISIQLGPQDPADGVVRVSTIGARTRDALAEPIGMVSGQTMMRLWDAVRRVLDMP
jgi:mRNA-degrading endonuclease toxin of MazEF toxin-antitoxin module